MKRVFKEHENELRQWLANFSIIITLICWPTSPEFLTDKVWDELKDVHL